MENKTQQNIAEMLNLPFNLKLVAQIDSLKLYSSTNLMKKYIKSLKKDKYFKQSNNIDDLILKKKRIIPCYLTKGMISFTFYKIFAPISLKSVCGFYSPQSKRIYILISNNTKFSIYISDEQLASLTLHECMHAYCDQNNSSFVSTFKKDIINFYDNFFGILFGKNNQELANDISIIASKFEKSSSNNITGDDVQKYIKEYISLLKKVYNDNDMVDNIERMMTMFMFNQRAFFQNIRSFVDIIKSFYNAYYKTFGTKNTQTLPVQEFFYPSEVIAIASELSKQKSKFVNVIDKLK